MGDAFQVDRRNGRCGATNPDPVTGRRDLNIPGSLRKMFGHKDLGIYLGMHHGPAGGGRCGETSDRGSRAPAMGVAYPVPRFARRVAMPRLRNGQNKVWAAFGSSGDEVSAVKLELVVTSMMARLCCQSYRAARS